MPEYLVKLADERGHVTEQVENAHTEAEVRDRLSQRGLYIQSVRAKSLLTGGKIAFGGRRRVKLQEFVIFNQQFYTLIHAGLPILTGLKLLTQRQKNAYFRSILEDVRQRVQAGEPLSSAFTAQKVFPQIYTTTLLAGEKSGNLEEVLTRYISYQRIALSLRKKLLSSLVYPALLVVAVTAMLIYLITFVVPQFGQLYEQMDAQLPSITVFMLNVGQIAQKYFWLVGLVLGSIIVFLVRWRKTPAGAERVDRVRLKIPLLGDVWLKYQIAMFSRTLSTLLAGGLPLVSCLETAGGSMESRLISKALSEATIQVREGQPLASSLEKTRVFPAMAVEMIEVGESTGALRQMLNSVAEFFEEDVQTTMAAAMSLIEPIILIGMAIVVGTVLVSLYMPVFSLGASGGLAR